MIQSQRPKLPQNNVHRYWKQSTKQKQTKPKMYEQNKDDQGKQVDVIKDEITGLITEDKHIVQQQEEKAYDKDNQRDDLDFNDNQDMKYFLEQRKSEPGQSSFRSEEEEEFYNDNISLANDLQQELNEKELIKEPSVLKRILKEFIEYSISTDNTIEKLKNLSQEQLKFILRFLVCLILKNFRSNSILKPRLKSDESLLYEVIDQNLVFKNALSVMYNQEQLSANDKKLLLQLGIGKDLLPKDFENEIFKENPNLNLEKDQIQIFNTYNVKFQFIGLKTPQILQQDIIWPKNLIFKFDFFNFETVKTDEVLLYDINNLQQNIRQVQENSHYILKRDLFSQQRQSFLSSINSNEYIIEEFQINENQQGIEDNHIHFLEYLNDKTLTIELIDGDSMFLFGITRLPLQELMLQGNQGVSKAVELDICETQFGRVIGKLQISLQNTGTFQPIFFNDGITEKDLNVSKIFRQSQSKGFHDQKQLMQKESKTKKKLISKPISKIDDLYLQQTIKSNIIVNDQELRKRARVERLKMSRYQQSPQKSQKPVKSTLSQQIYYPKNQQALDFHQHYLNLIDLIREANKEHIYEKAIHQGVDFRFTIDAMPGKIQLINLIIKNPYDTQEIFKINIEDPDIQYNKELQIVNNCQGEWDHWVKHSQNTKLLIPQNYDIVSQHNDLILEPLQQTPILLKFLSFRNVKPVNQNLAQVDSIHLLQKRKIKINITNRQDHPVCIVEVLIQPRMQHIDHYFQFNQPANNLQQELKVPNFISLRLISTGISLFSSDNKVKVSINQSDEDNIRLTFQGQTSGQKLTPMIFIYYDKYQSRLLGVAKVEINFLECYRIKLMIGSEQIFNLDYKPLQSTKVLIYSQNPNLIAYLDQQMSHNQKPLDLFKGKLIHLPLQIKCSHKIGIQKTILRCIDKQQKSIIKQWIIEIEAQQKQKTVTTNNYEFSLLRNNHSIQKFDFTNTIDTPVWLQFLSSRPGIMEIKGVNEKDLIYFDAHQQQEIELYIHAQNTKRDDDIVFLYINDIAYERICETLEFKIHYTGPFL